MAIDLQAQWFRDLAQLRYAATPKRLRALLDGETVLDTQDALLVFEPRRVVPWYAVPQSDLRLALTEHDPSPVPALRTPVLPPVTTTGTRCPADPCISAGMGRWASVLTTPIWEDG